MLGLGDDQRRQAVAAEVLASEQVFSDRLSVLERVFVRPLSGVLPKGTHRKLFGNLADIQGLSKELLNALIPRLSHSASIDAHLCLGDIFVQLGPYFKMYSIYISNFSLALHTIDELSARDPGFDAFVKNQNQRPECDHLVLQSFLILPVQRIPRIRLLLQDLLKRTPIQHPDAKSLQEALGLISHIADFVNETLREHANVEKMADIQRALIGYESSLFVPGRKFIQMGKIQKICRRSRQPRVLILFSDILVYASPSIIENQFLYHRSLSLDECVFKDLSDTIGIDL